jgi:hypothetical protein
MQLACPADEARILPEAALAYCAPGQPFLPLDGHSPCEYAWRLATITAHLSSAALVVPPTLAGPTDSDPAHRRTRRRCTGRKSPYSNPRGSGAQAAPAEDRCLAVTWLESRSRCCRRPTLGPGDMDDCSDRGAWLLHHVHDRMPATWQQFGLAMKRPGTATDVVEKSYIVRSPPENVPCGINVLSELAWTMRR